MTTLLAARYDPRHAGDREDPGTPVCSNFFTTAAWYGHLRYRNVSLASAIAISWGIALFEYLLQVPANRIGYATAGAYQLKILQEAIALAVCVGFAWLWLGEGFQARHLVSFSLILAAVAVAFR